MDSKQMNKPKLAQEIGHAAFGLVHQNEKTENNDPAKDRINGVVTNDNYNLMTSGSGAASGKARDQKIRRYAWEKIRKANVE